MKVKRKIIQIDDALCDGCGQCVPSCAEGAIEVIDGKARLVGDKYCDGLGACLGECPTGALSIIERETEEFDEEAVQEHLRSMAKQEPQVEAPTAPCACPSAQLQSFGHASPKSEKATLGANRTSALTHWPVQIRLVPPTAPFLKGADLLVAADCTPFAYPEFHEDFLAGKVLMVGCPKFDDVKGYVQKFVEIFNTADIKRVTVLVMEVPCCQGLPMIVEKAMKIAGKKISMETVMIGARGDILKRETLAP
jgi:Pyruvate/2-oxoacid:ferredoxin oxidoreductase delta subunit